ncbi:hypothetical protein V6N13_096101 [Hibiscus sabdariffa]
MHLKGLWDAFGHHGDVLNAFIPKKRSKSGRRFAFVRYATKADAILTISRLNGFILFGSRVSVNLARFRARMSFWRKVDPSKRKTNHASTEIQTRNLSQQNASNQKRDNLESNSSPLRSSSKGKPNPSGGDGIKVKGFIEEEALWKHKIHD